ncbi:MAG: hypothetical protein HC890_09690 [Chloroflexaceae bacterium]|nr:hypothetical protein [Chloroflexaceae bacterium]
MTGKVFDSDASSALVLILPIALVVVILFTFWPWILLIIGLGIAWRLWQEYQWQQWCKQVDPPFYQLIDRHRGCVTPLDLSIQANLTGRAAILFLEKKP